jgi:hypothetical protein
LHWRLEEEEEGGGYREAGIVMLHQNNPLLPLSYAPRKKSLKNIFLDLLFQLNVFE